MKKKIFIYGLGDMFQTKYDERMQDYLLRIYDLLGFVDKNIDKITQTIPNVGYYSEMPQNIEYDYIGITSEKFYDEIKLNMISKGILQEKILPKYFWRDLYTELYFPIEKFKGKGLEIGGPSVPFETIYNVTKQCDGINYSKNTIWGDNSKCSYEWEGKKIGKQIIAEATDLSCIPDCQYDYVLSSNNLEHIANPLKALHEFIRVIKHGGLMVLLLPYKLYSFDHLREDTTFNHILGDYENKINEYDLTHLEEILEKHDLLLDNEAGSYEQFKLRSLDNYNNRCLHHHVFSKKLLSQIAEYFNLEILYNGVFDKNLCLIAEKKLVEKEVTNH